MQPQELEAIKTRLRAADTAQWGDAPGDVRTLITQDGPTLVAEVERLRAALAFYADEESYQELPTRVPNRFFVRVLEDGGRQAREALGTGD